jgi:hypothetical protein
MNKMAFKRIFRFDGKANTSHLFTSLNAYLGTAIRQVSLKNFLLSIFVLASYAGYIWLRIQHSLRIHEPRMGFGDAHYYLEIASQPLFSKSFWIAVKPSGAPLFFKLFDGNPENIFMGQLWLSMFAWGILALAVLSAMHSYFLKALGFILILAFSLGQNIIMWDPLILSDSIAFSMLALFLASCIGLAVGWSWYKYFCLVIAAILLALVRDTFAYLLLMAGITSLVILCVTSLRKKVLFVSGLFLILFFLINAQATAAGRWRGAILMTMGLRILPNPEYLAYFEAHGMPVTDALMERSGQPFHADDFYNDPGLKDFRVWLEQRGRKEYFKFLWFFKADTLQSPLSNLQLIFNPDVYYYTPTGYRPIIKDAWLSELLYPVRFGIVAVLFANFMAALLVFPAFLYRQSLWAVPLMLILFSYPQALLVWHADANDMARHLLYHNVELRLGLWLLVLFVADFAIKQISSSIYGKKNDT